ncbi:MAG: O-antigen ligase family protein [bacterium]|nr:O-antigen ligase family protein [bacterium]
MAATSDNAKSYLKEAYSSKSVEFIATLVLAALVAVALSLVSMGREMFAAALILAAFGAALTLFPRAAFYLFLVSLAFYVPQRVSYSFAVHPFDLMMGIVVAGMLLEFLLRDRAEIRPAFFDLPFVVLIVATLVSTVFAHNPSYSVVPCARIIVIYLAFRAVFKFGLELGVRQILLFYIYIVFFLSLHNISLFVMHAGQIRVFGFSGLGYESFSMTALPMALAFWLWSESRRDKIKFGAIVIAIGIGILGTQARGPLLSVALAVPALLLMAAFKARRENDRRTLSSLKTLLLPLGGLAVLVVVLSGTLFAGSIGRYEAAIDSFTRPTGTIALRLVLWKTAVMAFLDHPFTGIGIGNFRIVHELYPALKTTPLHFYVKGMSAHNVILHYLAETGLVGALALTVLAWGGLKASYRDFRSKLSREETQITAALFIAMLVFCVTILYMRAWTWGQGGYVMALLFGLVAVRRHTRRSGDGNLKSWFTLPGHNARWPTL